MTKLTYLLASVAIFAVTSTAAEARFQVIRWPSGFCQVWNHSIPGKPFPPGWTASRTVHATFHGALNEKLALVSRRQCW
jgi:hypothetical protein